MRRPSRYPAGRWATFSLFLALASPFSHPLAAQDAASPTSKPTTAKPSTAKPSTAKPSTAKPSTRKPAPAPTAVPAPAPRPTDVRYKVKYTTGDQVTETVAYLRGTRERFEVADMVLIRQHDQKRAVQISRAAKTYLVTPLNASAAPPATPEEPSPNQKPAGIVTVTTTIVDTGERKDAFGTQARHVKTMIERQPQAGACDSTKQRIETDGWYIDAPNGLVAQEAEASAPAATGCRDEIKTSVNGDAAGLGFPIAYTTTFQDGEKPVAMTMEVLEFEVTKLDASLFEIPEGLTAAMNAYELSQAVSNANEQKLATEGPAATERKPGVMRVGVPEVGNKTTQDVDTRALRTQLIAELTEAKVEAIPFAALPQEELEQRAKALGCDYLLIAQITELKASKPGGLSRMMKATAGQDAAKDITEAKLTVQLMPAGGGKPRYSTNTSGKDGGIGVRTGLGLARFAGTMYLRYASPLGAMNSMGMMNMGGMGMLGNPMLMQMQTGGVMGTGSGMDRTAAAGMFLMDQAMAGSSARPDGGPSFDAALSEALDEGAKKIVENLKKK